MKSNYTNQVHLEGYVFNFGNDERRMLQKRKTGPQSKNPGQNYIRGEVNIATDEDATNVITVWYQYEPEFNKNGKPNSKYEELSKLLDTNKTYENSGKDASKVRMDGNLETNDFYTREGELASPMRIAGGFIHPLNGPIAANPATFRMDCVISKCVEVDPEDDTPYVKLNGYCFNFRKDIFPFEVNARTQGGYDYFANSEISNANPLCTTIWGNIVSSTIVNKITTESAFGEPQVRESRRSVRSWDVTGASQESYEWDDESFITKSELKKALQEREDRIAADKKRQDDYRAASEATAFEAPKAVSKAPAKKVVVEEDSEDFDF